jgi:hypothetical protein
MTGLLADPIPKLWLESMDGTVVIPLDSSTGWTRLPGSTGLEMPPVEVIASAIPGAPGAVVQDVRVQPRPVFLPIYGRSDTSVRNFFEMKDQIRSLVDPINGSFKIVGASMRGIRELVVTYDEGLEGADGQDVDGLSWCKIGLKATAHEPYARAREDRVLEFRVVAVVTPFLGVVGGTDTPWPRALSSSSVIGSGMSVVIDSEVPVYPTLELVGNMTSFLGTLSSVVTNPDGSTRTIEDREWSISVPSGVPALSTLRMVTDPRYRSIRMNGALAAGSVARGSTLRPFYPGTNVLSVVAPGGTEDTRVVLSWRELYRSLW